MKAPIENQFIRLAEQYVLTELNEHGYVLLEDFPEDEILKLLGSIGTIFMQESGARHAVKYEDGFDDYRYSKSLNEIGPHTEFPFYECPPRIQVLYCMQQANCGGGQTYLCPVNSFIKSLSDDQLELLTNTLINFSANKDLAGLTTRSASFPLLRKNAGSFIFRFSHNLLYYGDINAKVKNEAKVTGTIGNDIGEIVDKLLVYLEENRVEKNIPQNGLLLWHNHSVLHWRNSFTDKRRHLIRYLLD